MKIFHKTKIITVNDFKKKEQIQELFAKHNIEYKIKVKEILQKNPIDSAIIGTLGLNRIKIMYSFYVKKEDLLVVRELLKILWYSKYMTWLKRLLHLRIENLICNSLLTWSGGYWINIYDVGFARLTISFCNSVWPAFRAVSRDKHNTGILLSGSIAGYSMFVDNAIKLWQHGIV